MSDPLGRLFPGLDPWTGSLSIWSAGALAALLVVFCALVLSRAGREGVAGGVARGALILIGAGLTWLYLEGTARQDIAAERRALEQRLVALTARATMPGSPLACLDAMAGETVEGSCERTLFATPEGMASAVSYVAAQWTLFADISAFARRSKSELESMLADLRRAIEGDRYGLVAHVLAMREGCTPRHCQAATLLRDARRVNENLAQRTYDFYVARHASVWPAPAPGPMAQNPPGSPPGPAQGAIPGVTPGLPPSAAAFNRPHVPGPDVFFPSAASIPPVNIMTAEPAAEPETTGSATPRLQAPPRRAPPHVAAQPKQAPSAPAPMDLNAAARGEPKAPAAQ